MVFSWFDAGRVYMGTAACAQPAAKAGVMGASLGIRTCTNQTHDRTGVGTKHNTVGKALNVSLSSGCLPKCPSNACFLL